MMTGMYKMTDLLAPFTMDLGELDSHVSQICYLLPLEPVKVGLQGG
jgi:hypothetical protein